MPPASSSPAPATGPRHAPCRVLLVDDHPITRQGLKALIEQQVEFVVCGEADNHASALALAEKAQPHVTVLDITLPAGNGLDLLRELKAKAPDAGVIVLSMHDQQFYAERAARAGAAGYVMKEHASTLILQALRAVASGQTFFDAQTAARLKPQPNLKNGGGGIEQLSERELEVLRLIGSGYATREIATQLGLSVKTIDTYRDHLKQKLDLPDGEMLVHFAIRWCAGERPTLAKPN